MIFHFPKATSASTLKDTLAVTSVHCTSVRRGSCEDLTKKIAVYGTYEAKIPVRQRYWKWIYHRKGSKAGQKWYKKRVWKKTKRMRKAVMSGRYEFHGRGRDLYKAVILAQRYMPKGFKVAQYELLNKPKPKSVCSQATIQSD